MSYGHGDAYYNEQRWIAWNELERPSAVHPIKVTIRSPCPDRINGGPFMPSQKPVLILWTLDCGHVAGALENTVEQKLYCIFHDDLRPIIGVHIYEWHAACNHRDAHKCRFSKWAGLSRQNAASLANKHAGTHPSHAPFVFIEYVVNPYALAVRDKIYASKTRS